MGGKNKFDGNDQIKAGLNYYEHNAKVFRSHFNRDPNGLELYYLHFFGEGGGPAFLKPKIMSFLLMWPHAGVKAIRKDCKTDCRRYHFKSSIQWYDRRAGKGQIRKALE
jgi:hypothetical protein